jgi:hypothetical protein
LTEERRERRDTVPEKEVRGGMRRHEEAQGGTRRHEDHPKVTSE